MVACPSPRRVNDILEQLPQIPKRPDVALCTEPPSAGVFSVPRADVAEHLDPCPLTRRHWMMSDCVSQVELSVSCSNLLDKDVGSKSDPLCVLLQKNQDTWTEVAGRRGAELLLPSFSSRLRIQFHFESVQNLKFCDDDFLGGAELTLGQIVSSKSLTRPLQLKKDKPAGKGSITLVCVCVCVPDCPAGGAVSICAEEVKDNRAVSLELEAKNLDKKVVKNNLNPVWKKFTVPLHTFCSGDLNKTIKKSSSFDCVHPEKQKKKKNYKTLGIVSQYSFLDYVMGGCQINFTVGIDFTGSNGNPESPQSLHYLSPDGLNQYLSALWSCGPGGPALRQEAHHDFALNFNPANLSAKQYFVLLILTDGEITDLDQTRDAIVRASTLPLSIIIVGVGPADFSAMKLLDGDDGVLKSTSGEKVSRDIVQFVPFRDFKNAPAATLAASVLAEVRLSSFLISK
ncbi:hypothetical protein WMY93_032303 [Mugilogobius chulae]|uniref:C2 domain-containing protein n=1 Tax=Mugilogobius chulae TaxID=88201 RepID=A0AAW0MLU3_9GOBI